MSRSSNGQRTLEAIELTNADKEDDDCECLENDPSLPCWHCYRFGRRPMSYGPRQEVDRSWQVVADE